MLPPMVSMPNGAYRFGILESRNACFLWTRLNLPSQTATLPLPKLGAYRCGPLDVFAIARPVKSPPRTLATVCAEVNGGTSWLQAVILPLIEEKRKFAAPCLPPDLTT